MDSTKNISHSQPLSNSVSGKSDRETAIHITESKSTKGKGHGVATIVAATTKGISHQPQGGWKKGVAIFDFILRLSALAAALGATTAMGTTEQTLPFFTQFFQFQASYDDLPAFMFFVIANAITSSYLVLSLPFSIVCIVRPHAAGPRLLLVIGDTVVLALTTAAASAAAAIVYLAHNGNPSANWNAICQQFTDFCQAVSGAVVASFIAAAVIMFIIVLSAFALRRR